MRGTNPTVNSYIYFLEYLIYVQILMRYEYQISWATMALARDLGLESVDKISYSM